jgi:hypothetical protein
VSDFGVKSLRENGFYPPCDELALGKSSYFKTKLKITIEVPDRKVELSESEFARVFYSTSMLMSRDAIFKELKQRIFGKGES